MFVKATAYLLFIVALSTPSLKANLPQNPSQQSFDELHARFKSAMIEKKTSEALHYFEAFKQKAVRENHIERYVNGYRSMAIWQTDLEQKVAYADSAISIATHAKRNDLIGNALYTKAVVYYKYNNWSTALDYYLQADKYISMTDNEYLIHKMKFSIANAKYTLGQYEEARPLLQQCIAYFELYDDYNHQMGYLTSLHSLGLCLNRSGRYNESSEINGQGLQKVKEFGLDEMEYSFTSSEGINQYSLGNHEQALELLNYSLPFFEQMDNTKQQTVIHFYIGKSYFELHQPKSALLHFKRVDSLFSQTGYLRDDMGENYLFLIADAQKQNDVSQELYYTNRLIEADKLLHNQYKDIATVIHKKYDTQKLQESKAALEKLLGQKKANNTWLTVVLLIALIGLLVLSVRYVYYRKKFKKLYQQFIDNLPNPSAQTHTLKPATENLPDVEQLEIKEDVVHKVLKGLRQFEKNKGFLKHNLTLSKLATSLKTNPKYLSKIIIEHKQKEYIYYINDLRINHLMELLKTKKHREYTIEALAKEIGFSSAKGFNLVFYNTTGMKFSAFLNEFRKEKEHYSLSLDLM